jgi:hypothetical protein
MQTDFFDGCFVSAGVDHCSLIYGYAHHSVIQGLCGVMNFLMHGCLHTLCMYYGV